MMAPIAVALSGGVDSAVAAARLVDTGARVIGLTMKTAQATAGATGHQGCCGLQDVDDARRIARHLDIPHYVVDMTAAFGEAVIGPFVRAYVRGATPNPCVDCNTAVKFGALLDRARALGADRVATGHYARVAWESSAGRWTLRRGADPSKDQSYVLCRLTQEQLAASLFPLGDSLKTDVRAEAAARGLPVATKPDSQEICFIPANDYRAFVVSQTPEASAPGPIRDATTGQCLGEHPGVAHFTIGQRRGLGLGGGDSAQYVVGLESEARTVLVGPPELLYSRGMTVSEVVWVSQPPPSQILSGHVQIRHQHTAARATLEVIDTQHVRVCFATPERAVTPGQTAAFYREDRVLCGGVISQVSRVDTPIPLC